jgi:hypothetical protein
LVAKGSFSQFFQSLFGKRSVGQIVFCITNQTTNLHLGGAQDLQTEALRERSGDDALKLHLVSQLGRVNAITCEFSMDIVGRIMGEVYTGNQFPKRDKLLNVINVKTC